MPQGIQLFADAGFLGSEFPNLFVEGFRNVVVVIADKQVYLILLQERSQFPGQLGGERLVVAENQGRSVPQSRQGVGHDKGFAGSGDSFQD